MYIITDLQNNILDFDNNIYYLAYNNIGKNFYITTNNQKAIAIKINDNIYYLKNIKIRNDIELKELKKIKQEKNKKELSNYLKNNPLIWKDNKKYGVTEEDQRELGAEITRYYHAQSMNKNYIPIWHAIKEASVEWSIENLIQLEIDIAEYIKPLFLQMQEKKEAINNCKTIKELLNI